VIRDVDSSALHILRILQEEAMKEGTAALHVQVPVEVATFLLNEKRTDIAKLEFRLKVTVVLIPNKYLETPNYSIERLKHDDPRLEDSRASYAMADEPATETPYQQKKTEQVAAKPRQEAVVKGVTPAQPAPIVAKPAEQKPAEKGLIATIMGWFSGGSTPKEAEKPATRGQGDRDGRQRGRGGRGERGSREGRESRDNRDRSGRDAKEAKEPREPKSRQENNRSGNGRREERNEPRQEGEARPEPRARGERADRKPRQERGDRSAERPVETTEDAQLAQAIDQAPPLAEGAEQSDRTGRRRRRRGRGGRSREEGQDGQLSLETTSEELTNETVAVSASAPVAPQLALPAPVAAEAITLAPAVTETPAPQIAAAPAPVTAPVIAPTPAPAVISEAALQETLGAAGLQWVQTDPGKAISEAVAEPAPKLGRAPRKSAATAATEEPLVMVETRQNNG
jgi:ribonuclease E